VGQGAGMVEERAARLSKPSEEGRRLKWACLPFLMFKTPVEWRER